MHISRTHKSSILKYLQKVEFRKHLLRMILLI